MESGTFRKKRKNYAQVSNTALLDKNLSLKAKGLYSLIESLLSIPNFTLYKDYLINCSTDGRSSFDSAWKELKNNGYLVQDKIQTHKGFVYEYELLDEPNKTSNLNSNDDDNNLNDTSNTQKTPTSRFPVSGESESGNLTFGKPVSKNNILENNILENNINTTTSINISKNANKKENVVVVNKNNVAKEINDFLKKIELEKERNRQAYQLEEECFNGVDESLVKLLNTLNNCSLEKISKLNTEDCWKIYYMYLLLKKVIPDYFDECPKISKSPEAYIVGMIKNM